MENSKRIFITFDMDWASEEVLKYWHDIIKKLDIKVTLNVTNNSKTLEAIKNDKQIELGIHPNFNKLLLNYSKNLDYIQVLNEVKSIIPEAVTVRSHSLVCGSQILSAFQKIGLKKELNLYIPPMKGNVLKPWSHEGELQRIPFIFEDDLYMQYEEKYSINSYLSDEFDMERVFNFHPIHVFLNTESLDRYEKCKIFNNDFSELKKYRNKSIECGTEVFLNKLVSEARLQNYEFEFIRDL